MTQSIARLPAQGRSPGRTHSVAHALTACAVLLFLAVAPTRAAGQDTTTARRDSSALEKRITHVLDSPVHPVVDGIAPGGGVGAGIGYTTARKEPQPWTFTSRAVITSNNYWKLEGNERYGNEWLEGGIYGRIQDLKRLDFYGVGSSAPRSARTTFRWLDRIAGAAASVRPPQFNVLALGARVDVLWPDLGRGGNPKYPSIEERFTQAEAPGLDEQPRFMAYTAFANLNWPGGNTRARIGADAHAAFSRYRARQGAGYDFDRVTLELQQRLPSFVKSHRLTLHEWYSTTGAEPGNTVPFYLQQTLGGNGDVHPFNEDFLGTDASKATLRGYPNLRFRGAHLYLLQAEYRLKVVGPIDATVFVDAGNVAATRKSLSTDDIKKDFGFSLSYMAGATTLLRMDVGTGGGEGTRAFFSVGSRVP